MRLSPKDHPSCDCLLGTSWVTNHIEKMTIPTHSLRTVFAMSVFACALVFVLFVRGRVSWTDDFWIQLVSVAATISIVICLLVFRKGRLYLSNVSVGNFFSVFLPQLVFMYFASAVGLTAIALAVSYAVTLSAASSIALATLAGLWLALLFAPGMACLSSWHKLREPMSGRS